MILEHGYFMHIPVHCITDVWVAWVTVYYQWEQPAVGAPGDLRTSGLTEIHQDKPGAVPHHPGLLLHGA